MPVLLEIFLAFLIPGLIGFGGGPASIAIINNAVVNTFGLVSQSDMNMIISISNALPGPIATLLALGVGYLSAGIVGGIVAMVAIVLPSCIAIILLHNFLNKHRNDYRVKRISKYILPLIIILFVQIATNFFTQSFVVLNNNIATMGIIVISVIAIVKLKIHPAIMILSAMVFGYFII